MALAGDEEAAVRVNLGADALLRQLAHVPVLAVDEIEDLDDVHRVEVRLGHRGRVEDPIADDARDVRTLGPEGVDDAVVRQEADEDIRQRHDAVVLALVGGRLALPEKVKPSTPSANSVPAPD